MLLLCQLLKKLAIVGHEIKHRFENDDGSLTWYDGQVISFNDGLR